MTWPSPSTMKMPSRMGSLPISAYTAQIGVLFLESARGHFVTHRATEPTRFGSAPCRRVRAVEINPRIFVRQFGHRPCFLSLHDPATAPLVPRAVRRLAPRKRVALAAPLPGRAHLLPRRHNRPG